MAVMARRQSTECFTQADTQVDGVLKQITGIVSGCDYDPRREMHYIDPKTVLDEHWVSQGVTGLLFPSHVSTTCGHRGCKAKSYFALTVKSFLSEEPASGMLEGKCPGCSKISKFYVVGVFRSRPKQCESIWQYPIPEIRSLIVSGDSLPRGFTKKLLKRYSNAVRTYNAGDWSSSVSQCANVVEGIAKSSFPQSNGKSTISKLFGDLSVSLKDNPDYSTILRPITSLSSVLCISRNPGAHFDTEKEPSQELASKLLDLVEFLITYIYLLPVKAKELKEVVDKLGPGDVDEVN